MSEEEYCHDEDKKTMWLEKMQHQSNLDESRAICEQHFAKEENRIITAENNQICTPLQLDAVPSLYLDEVEDSSRACETETKRSLETRSVSQQQNQLPRIIETPQGLTVFIEEDDEDIDEMIFIKRGEFVPKHELNQKPAIQIFTTQFKLFALQLYSKYPSSYRAMCSSLNLPRISTLYRLLIPRSSGLREQVIKALKTKVDSMTTPEKQCVVCIGTLKLTPSIEYDDKGEQVFGLHELGNSRILETATLAIVVMVRGLFHNWKQAVDFGFLSNKHNPTQTRLLIEEIVGQIYSIGLNVRAIMSDLDTDAHIAHESEITAQKSYVVIEKKKIYYIYDPVYLMLSLRDQFVKQPIMYPKEKVAQWNHIAQVFVHDNQKQARLAPKMTIYRRPDICVEVQNTAEIFSEATAIAMSTHTKIQIKSQSAKTTQAWILTLNKLMQMLDFSRVYYPPNNNDVFSGEDSQVAFLEGMVSHFYNLRFLKINYNCRPHIVHVDTLQTKEAKFIEGFRVTINSILQLHEDLTAEKCWYPIVGLTRDCLTDFFHKVHKKYNIYPTAKELTMSIRTFPIFNTFQYNVKKRRLNDLDNFLSYLREMPDIDIYEEKPRVGFVDLCSDDIEEFSTVEMSSLGQMALYLLNKCYQRHADCSAMKSFVLAANACYTDTSTFGYVAKDGIIINTVPREFWTFVGLLQGQVKQCFTVDGVPWTVSGLQRSIQHITFQMPCECFPLDYVQRLFIKFTLFLVLKHNA